MSEIHKPNVANVITVLNLKGGVGKTHTSWLLASVCQERSQRVLAVDLDMQGNLSNSFLNGNDPVPGVEMFFHPGVDPSPDALVRNTSFDFIDLIPASARLQRFDVSDQKAWEKADLHLSLLDPVASLRPRYDYILFDCPPRLSLVSFAALCASDFVIVPLEAADWGAQGIVQVAAAIEYVQKRFNPRLQLLGYLVSRFKPRRTYQQSYLQKLREHFGKQAFDAVIPDLAKFEQSVTDRFPITLHAKRSKAAVIARGFFDEVESRIESLRSSGFERRQAGVQRDAIPAA
jgi:chromosome partitioning protein